MTHSEADRINTLEARLAVLEQLVETLIVKSMHDALEASARRLMAMTEVGHA